jgi:hypothetical protein
VASRWSNQYDTCPVLVGEKRVPRGPLRGSHVAPHGWWFWSQFRRGHGSVIFGGSSVTCIVTAIPSRVTNGRGFRPRKRGSYTGPFMDRAQTGPRFQHTSPRNQAQPRARKGSPPRGERYHPLSHGATFSHGPTGAAHVGGRDLGPAL